MQILRVVAMVSIKMATSISTSEVRSDFIRFLFVGGTDDYTVYLLDTCILKNSLEAAFFLK